MDILAGYLGLLNPLTVAASALAMLTVGYLWFSRFLFGRAWVRHSGIRPGDLRAQDLRRILLVDILAALFKAALIGMIAEHGAYATPLVLCALGLIWLFIMTEQLLAFLRRREPFTLFLLATLRSLAMLLAGGMVFCMWG